MKFFHKESETRTFTAKKPCKTKMIKAVLYCKDIVSVNSIQYIVNTLPLKQIYYE